MINKYSNTSTNSFIWIIVVLIILNVSTIGTIFFRNYKYRQFHKIDKKHFPVQHAPHFFKMKGHEKDTHFTEHSKFMKEFRNEAGDLAGQMKEKRQEILDQLSAENVDTNYLYRLANEFGDLHKELKMLTIDFYLKTKAVCSADEQDQLYHYFNYLLKKGDMHGQHFMKSHKHFKRKKKQDQQNEE